jgi:hypothetical protein
MRLFAEVADLAKSNRYLIAYAVATSTPRIVARPGSPLSLVALSHRSLDKDANRRLASVNWQDFLSEDPLRQYKSILGIGPDRPSRRATSFIPGLCKMLEQALDARLIEEGVHCRHNCTVVGTNAANLNFSWRPSVLGAGAQLTVSFDLRPEGATAVFECNAALPMEQEYLNATAKGPSFVLPEDRYSECPLALCEYAFRAFMQVSADIVAIRQQEEQQ